MPSLSCKSFGLDCDWQLRTDDVAELIAEGFKHTEDMHPHVLKDELSKMPISTIVRELAKAMKP